MIAKLEFGKTGHFSTRIIFGAAALSNVTPAEADQTLEVLLEHGINHIDTAAGYGDSELRIGPWMEKYRKKFFLATKIFKRSYQDALNQIYNSLDRLQVSSVDLIQLHNLTAQNSWKKVMGPDGALKAAVEVRELGLVKYIGVTGHGYTVAAMHKRSLEQFNFDSVLLPYNYVMMQNPEYAAEFNNLLEICKERNVAIQTIKSLARGPWGLKKKMRSTWYEPFEDQADITRAVHWVLGREGIFLNSSSDIHILPKILDAAMCFKKGPPEEEMQEKYTQLRMKPIFDGRSLLM